MITGLFTNACEAIRLSTSNWFWLLTASMSFAAAGYSQSITFEKNYGWKNNEDALFVHETADGGYFLIGNTQDDIYLVKTDSLGKASRTRIYDFGVSAGVVAADATSDNGYILFAMLAGQPYRNLLIKVDANGDTLWTNTMDIVGGDDIRQTFDGGYVIAGTLIIAGKRNIIMIRTDDAGDTLWTRIFEGQDDLGSKAVVQTADSGFMVVGYIELGPWDFDTYLIRTDANGDTLWTKMVGGTGGRDIQAANDGNYIIMGKGEYVAPDWLGGLFLAKVNSTGDTLWTKDYTYSYSNWFQGESVYPTNDGGFIIGGIRYDDSGSTVYSYMLKTNLSGDTVWSRMYNARSSGDFAIQTKDGGYALAGARGMGALMKKDAYLIKTDSLGLLTTSTGIDRFLPPSPIYMHLYPNPVGEAVTVSISGNATGLSGGMVIVYDITGRRVKAYEIRSGQDRVTVYAHDIGAGVFLFRLSDRSGTLDTRRVIIIE